MKRRLLDLQPVGVECYRQRNDSGRRPIGRPPEHRTIRASNRVVAPASVHATAPSRTLTGVKRRRIGLFRRSGFANVAMMRFAAARAKHRGERRSMATIVGQGEYQYRITENWAKLPDGWSFKEVAAVGVDKN